VPRHLVASRRLPALLVLALALQATGAEAGLVLNEVLYDPEGPDEGHEFVELWNTDSIPAPLEGITLEAGDGSRPGLWTVLYTGAPGDVAPPRAPFLIAGAALRAALQNGPDALRLSRGAEVLDLVGYGALAAPDLYEGSPAPDAASGQSLARARDGVDSGINAADWVPEPEPTPGLANHPEFRLVMARGSVVLDPEVAWPGESMTLSVGVRNRGGLSLPGSRWRLEAAMRGSSVASPGVTIAPGESVSVRCLLTAPDAGRFDVLLILEDMDGSVIADTLVSRSRAGAGPLLVNEIAFHDRGAGEWVEVIVREDVLDLAEYSLTDSNGRPYAIDPGPAPRGAHRGDVLVLAESPAALRSAYQLPDSVVLGCRGGWPALNDTDGSDGIADRVRLLDPAGIASDAVPYRARSVERDGSIERLGESLPSAAAGSWSECIDPRAGTPGRPNSMRAPAPGGGTGGNLLLASDRIVRRGAPVVLSMGEEARGARVRVLVHDLLGRTRRHLVDGQRVLGEAAFVWDGRDDEGSPVPPGAYVARAETLPDHGETARSGNLALTVLDR